MWWRLLRVMKVLSQWLQLSLSGWVFNHNFNASFDASNRVKCKDLKSFDFASTIGNLVSFDEIHCTSLLAYLSTDSDFDNTRQSKNAKLSKQDPTQRYLGYFESIFPTIVSPYRPPVGSSGSARPEMHPPVKINLFVNLPTTSTMGMYHHHTKWKKTTNI